MDILKNSKKGIGQIYYDRKFDKNLHKYSVDHKYAFTGIPKEYITEAMYIHVIDYDIFDWIPNDKITSKICEEYAKRYPKYMKNIPDKHMNSSLSLLALKFNFKYLAILQIKTNNKVFDFMESHCIEHPDDIQYLYKINDQKIYEIVRKIIYLNPETIQYLEFFQQSPELSTMIDNFIKDFPTYIKYIPDNFLPPSEKPRPKFFYDI